MFHYCYNKASAFQILAVEFLLSLSFQSIAEKGVTFWYIYLTKYSELLWVTELNIFCVRSYYETKSYINCSSLKRKEVHFKHVSIQESDFKVRQELWSFWHKGTS